LLLEDGILNLVKTQEIMPFEKKVTQLTIISVCVNLTLTTASIIIGILFSSMALISDGIHSLSDLLSDVVVFVATKMASRPPDDNHHYGHGKFETFAEIGVALFLFTAATVIIWNSIQTIYHGQHVPFSYPVLLCALFSVIAKEILYQWTIRLSALYDSRMLHASAWHHRSDSLSSVVVILGMFAALLGLPSADAWAACLVGIFIGYMGLGFFKKALGDLSESAPDKELIGKIDQVLRLHPDVRSYHRLRVRRMGRQVMMDMHLVMHEDISLKKAHEIANSVERKLQLEIGPQTNVLVHPEPENERHRSGQPIE
jgi:cation diffusion facilitator family transporter